VLNADLTNDRTNDTTQANYGYGVIAMNSDGHLTINGNGDSDTSGDQSEVDNYGDHVAAATGNYKVRIDNATGAGSVADYKGNELIYVNDTNSTRPSLQPTKLTSVLTPIRHSSRVTPLFCSRWN
jgi:hypothetical protein